MSLLTRRRLVCFTPPGGNMFFNEIRRVLALAVFLAIGSNANAALTGTYCDSGVGDLNPAVNNETPAQNVSDVAFGAQFANNCHGRQTGNDDVAIVNEIWGGTWSFLAKDEGSANVALGLEWLLTSSGSSNPTSGRLAPPTRTVLLRPIWATSSTSCSW